MWVYSHLSRELTTPHLFSINEGGREVELRRAAVACLERGQTVLTQVRISMALTKSS